MPFTCFCSQNWWSIPTTFTRIDKRRRIFWHLSTLNIFWCANYAPLQVKNVSVLMEGTEMLCRWRKLGIRLGAPIMYDFKRKCQLILSSGFCIPEPLTMHTGINRRQVYPIFKFPSGNSSCVETLGEPRQRYQALNHMCNQSKLMARRQVRVTSWPGSLKAHDVQPAPSFCKALCVCQSRYMFCKSYLLLFVKLHKHTKLQYDKSNV